MSAILNDQLTRMSPSHHPEILSQRTAGIVLHPTSLPGPHGCGDFGPNAYYFVDWLHTAGQTLWQTLPLGPIGLGNSPYMGRSALAGNPLLVALEPMIERGWIDSTSLHCAFDQDRVNFAVVVPWRMQKLREAFAGFQSAARDDDIQSLTTWLAEQSHWIADYALFMALDDIYCAVPWTDWPASLANRDPEALSQARAQHAQKVAFWGFVQWQFDVQLGHLKAYANAKGVHMVGDLPIFVAHHSSDCWARPALFLLDSQGQPSVVAGVPPDFFSATGQRWGNPLYDWEAMQADGFRWWIERIRRQLSLTDVLRIDHFRGFAAYWEIPASEPTAINGRWVPAPGDALFRAVEAALGKLPIIAEDLGIITPEVDALRMSAGFPGMRVLQFAFADNADNSFLPHNYARDTVVYCGTHDNDMARGWWACCSARERAFAAQYLGTDGANIHWDMIRVCAQSVANHALCQFQDVLGLDGYHRMNTPGTVGCWTWRFRWDWVSAESTERLARMTAACGRTRFERLHLPA